MTGWKPIQDAPKDGRSVLRGPGSKIAPAERDALITQSLRTLEHRSIYPILVMALATGMRRGKLLALRWKDVNLDGGMVQVEQSLEQTKSGLRFKPPKTKHGRRSISLPPRP